jgi:DNA-binding GntR family transcriptional regulator
LGCEGGTRWCKISSVRVDDLQGQEPIGWTDAYVDITYSAIGDHVRRSPHTLISSLIETLFGRRVAHVRQEVGAISLPPKLAATLHAEPGSPALKIVRRYSDSSRSIFEVTVTVHPADRFKLSMQMNRSDT